MWTWPRKLDIRQSHVLFSCQTHKVLHTHQLSYTYSHIPKLVRMHYFGSHNTQTISIQPRNTLALAPMSIFRMTTTLDLEASFHQFSKLGVHAKNTKQRPSVLIRRVHTLVFVSHMNRCVESSLGKEWRADVHVAQMIDMHAIDNMKPWKWWYLLKHEYFSSI